MARMSVVAVAVDARRIDGEVERAPPGLAPELRLDHAVVVGRSSLQSSSTSRSRPKAAAASGRPSRARACDVERGKDVGRREAFATIAASSASTGLPTLRYAVTSACGATRFSGSPSSARVGYVMS